MIDQALQKGWPLKRIETVLRAILRAGAYELEKNATCRPASSSPNMSTLPMPSSIATRPAWSMRCSTSSRGNCVRASSTPRQGEARAQARATLGESGEDRLIARYFKPIARHPGALGLIDDAAVLMPPTATRWS